MASAVLAPDISVVVPAFRARSTIQRAIESILDGVRTHSVEVVVVDDGCPEGSGDYVDSLVMGPSVRVINHDRNCGLGSARNTGIKAVGGKYVAFLDADDFWSPTVDLAEIFGEISRFVPDIMMLGVQEAWEMQPNAFDFRAYRDSGSLPLIAHELRLSNAPFLSVIQPCWSMLYRSDFLIQKGMRFKRRQFEDHDFGLECVAAAGSISLRLDLDFVCYRKALDRRSLSSRPFNDQSIECFLDHIVAVFTTLAATTESYPPSVARQIVAERAVHYLGRLITFLKQTSDDGLASNLADLSRAFLKVIQYFDTKTLLVSGKTVESGHAIAMGESALSLFCSAVADGNWEVAQGLATAQHERDTAQAIVRWLADSPESANQAENVARHLQAQFMPGRSPFSSWLRRGGQKSRVDQVDILIGMTKCGTTTIQNFCVEQSVALQEIGIYFPLHGMYFDNRKDKVRTSGHAFRSPGWEFDWELIQHEITLRAPTHLLLASENVLLSPDQVIVKLQKRLEGLGPVRAHIIVRPYQAWLLSQYVEWVVGGHHKLVEPFVDALPWILDRAGPAKIIGSINKVKKVFGQNNVVFHRFEDLMGPTLASDFLAGVYPGISVPRTPMDKSKENRSSISSYQLPVWLAINSVFRSQFDSPERFQAAFYEAQARAEVSPDKRSVSELEALSQDNKFKAYCAAVDHAIAACVAGESVAWDTFRDKEIFDDLRKRISESETIVRQRDQMVAALRISQPLFFDLKFESSDDKDSVAARRFNRSQQRFHAWLIQRKSRFKRIPGARFCYRVLRKIAPRWFSL